MVITNWSFTKAGNGSITVIDRADSTRRSTSNTITVKEVYLSAVISPTTVFASEPVLNLVVEARDSTGALIPAYRGEIDINPSTSVSGLNLSTSGIADYTFTATSASDLIMGWYTHTCNEVLPSSW